MACRSAECTNRQIAADFFFGGELAIWFSDLTRRFSAVMSGTSEQLWSVLLQRPARDATR